MKLTLYVGDGCYKCAYLEGYLPNRCKDRNIEYDCMNYENLAIPPTSIPVATIDDDLLDYDGLMQFITNYKENDGNRL